MNKDQKKVWDILEGPKIWTATVIADPDDSTQSILALPPDLLSRMGWGEGDSLHIDTTETGCIILAKL